LFFLSGFVFCRSDDALLSCAADDFISVFFGKPEETKFEVIYQPGTQVKAADGVTIGFAIDSLKDKLALLDSRSIPHSPVMTPSPHAAFCFFTDLNGVNIQLFEEH